MWKNFTRHTRDLCLKISIQSQKIQCEHYRQICCFTKTGQCNGKNDSFKEKRGKRPSWESNTQVQQHAWLGAFGWSGILVLGWYLCQPNRLRTLLSNKAHSDDFTYKSPGQALIDSALAQPLNHIVPKTIPSAEPSLENSHFVNETLDQAADRFAHAHGAVENRIGVELARRNRFDEAALLFEKAADRGHAAASFNLGLCHELGLGTTQDFCKAAEYYEVASSGGHPTAKYNLGVFYVHGWGGKETDRNRARQLFADAAKLGQIDARRALGMEETGKQRQNGEKTTVLTKANDIVSQLVLDSKHKYTTMLEV